MGSIASVGHKGLSHVVQGLVIHLWLKLHISCLIGAGAVVQQ